jgi:aldose 1-epimerase
MNEPSIRRREFGVLSDGRSVTEVTLDNGAGLSLSAIPLGGIVTALRVPDRHGAATNVVLALPTLADYETRNPHLGTIVGRCANRIAQGRFRIDSEEFLLATNDGPHSLHGGARGFGSQWWDIDVPRRGGDGSVTIELSRTSPDREQGYPGRLQVRVRYTLTSQQEWRIDYHATCDRPTIVNLSHHDYFNLAGGGSALDHRLTIPADRYCPVDAGLIPQGIASVDGTPFDFRSSTPIGKRIRDLHPQLLRARGYDHNWVLRDSDAPGLRLAAQLHDPASGRSMEVHTSEPGLQFYSGNFLDGTLPGAHGQALRQGDGLCLETQHFPDTPNQPGFPTTVLRPGQTWSSTTVHRFGIAD